MRTILGRLVAADLIWRYIVQLEPDEPGHGAITELTIADAKQVVGIVMYQSIPVTSAAKLFTFTEGPIRNVEVLILEDAHILASFTEPMASP